MGRFLLSAKWYTHSFHFYSKTNQMHKIPNLFYFGTTFYMFRTISPSIIRSLRLYIQHQAYGTEPDRYAGQDGTYFILTCRRLHENVSHNFLCFEYWNTIFTKTTATFLKIPARNSWLSCNHLQSCKQVKTKLVSSWPAYRTATNTECLYQMLY